MGGIANTIGGIFGQTAQAFTPQNQYSANQAGQNLNGLLSGSQANIAQDQANENSLASTLQQQANGQGPNPAQMELQNALTQNQKQAAGQAASQKGINPGLAQKQIATNSANQAQQAAGQGALMGAQQQLAAQGQLAGLYGNMANQNLTNQGQYEGVLNAQNGINSGVSAQNTAADQATNSGLLQGVASGIGSLLYKGGEVGKYADGGQVRDPDPVKAQQVSNTFKPNGFDQAVAHPIDTISKYFANGGSVDPSNFASAFAQGLNSDAGSAVPSAQSSASLQMANQMAAQGGGPTYASGVVPLKFGSGKTPSTPKDYGTGTIGDSVSGGGTAADQSILGGGSTAAPGGIMAGGEAAGGGGIMSTLAADPELLALAAAHGGQVPPSSIFHPNHPVMAALKARGGPVPGQGKVPGDSIKNDVVPAVLSPKEIVLPRSVTLSDNPGDKAKSFVEQIKGKKSKGGYADVLEAKRKAKS